MVLKEKSKVRIRGIKGRLEEREGDFLAFLEILRRKEKGTTREKKERRKRENKP